MKGLLTSILTVLTFSGLQAQPLPNTPKLVIGLTIDQLRTDYLEAFSTLYADKGFKRLWKDGHVFRNAQYTFSGIDKASAIAAIYTGTTPSINGIIGAKWLETSTLRSVSCVDDPAYMGNYTDESSSPAQLLTSTLSDELKIGTRNKGLVYAIAPCRETAILSAGHAANGAFWLNDKTGKWCGTTYYTEFPWWLNQYNDRQAVDFRISNIVWTPTHPVESYKYLPEWREEPFKYKFDDDRINKYRRLIASPFINDEINALTQELLDKSTLGSDDTPDLLSLTYYAGNYAHKSVQECAMEIQDTYVRLDKNIAELLELIDKKIGLANVIFFITSTGYVDSNAPDQGLYNVPTGEFHLNRCAALLNMYLMATYGEGHYVESYYEQQLYLDHKVIEKKQLSLPDVQEKAASFLMQFSGVNEVYSTHRLLLGSWNPEMHLIRNGFHRKRSGDLLIDVLPGWAIVDEKTGDNKVIRHGYIPTPLIFLGGSVKPAIINTPITIDRIAPTVAHFMRIRAPNACTSISITDIR